MNNIPVDTILLGVIAFISIFLILAWVVTQLFNSKSRNFNQNYKEYSSNDLYKLDQNNKKLKDHLDSLFQEKEKLENQNQELRNKITQMENSLEFKDNQIKKGDTTLLNKTQEYNTGNKGYFNSHQQNVNKDYINNKNQRIQKNVMSNNISDSVYYVQYDLKKKNGDLIIVSFSDMYLSLESDYYKLKHNGQLRINNPEDLIDIELSYRVLNPDNQNNKPLQIISEPIYILYEDSNQARLKNKGKVKFI